MQNFDGKHEDITVVCTRIKCLKTILLLKVKYNVGARRRIKTAGKTERFQCSYNVTCIEWH